MKREFIVSIEGRENHVNVLNQSGASFLLEINGKEVTATVTPAFTSQFTSSSASAPAFQVESKIASSPDIIAAPFAGIVSQLKVNVGVEIEAGQELLVIEAMKMENPIKATTKCSVVECFISVGSEVKKGQPLLRIKI